LRDGEFGSCGSVGAGLRFRCSFQARSTRTAGTHQRREVVLEGDRLSRLSILDRRPREEDVTNEEVSEVIGFLSSHGVLYCSQACASSHGVSAGYEVDQDEYESLVESGSLQPVGLCPSCGAEFPVSWPEREPN
jgi:hypothetical protein